jgi:hypothetical protein
MMTALLVRKASDADAPNFNPWRPAIFDHPFPRRVFPGRTSWRPAMRKLLTFLIALAALCFPTAAPAGWQSRDSNYDISIVSGGGGSYSGPGDTVSGATVFYSCARVYSLAGAGTSTNLCDLVDSAAPSTPICTLRGTTAGTVDLAGTYCTGSVTPATKCAAATGGVCYVSKAYNQVSPGTLDVVQTTNANQPKLKFSAINGLPSINFDTTAKVLISSASISSTPEPYTFSFVAKRTGNTTNYGAIIGINGAEAGFTANVASWYMFTGTSIPTEAATDNVFHSNQATFNNAGGTSAQYIDGTAAAGSIGGSVTVNAAIHVGQNSSGVNNTVSELMEIGIWPLDFTVSSRQPNMNTNQHGANGYNF